MKLKHIMSLASIMLCITILLTPQIALSPVSPNLWLDDLPSTTTYTIKTDGVNYWAVRYDGKILWDGTNDDLTIQNAIDQANSVGGGIVFVKQGTYSASITVTSNVLLLLEYGVTGVSYTTSGTGIALRYMNGYVMLDAPLNMTQHQIIYGLFHSGSTRPSNPTEAQFFYDTDDHALFVYNGTAWEDYSLLGAEGEKGEAGEGNFGPYTYIVYYNSTSAEYEYRDWQGQLQDADGDGAVVTNWALGNLTVGRTSLEKVVLKGYIETESPIQVPNYAEIEIDGTIRLGSGSDCNVVENANPSSYNCYVWIHGGWIDGNEAGQSSGAYNGIYWRNAQTTGIPPKPIIFSDLRIINCEQDGMLLDNTGGNGEYFVHHIWSHGHGRHCFYINEVSDSYFAHLKQLYSDNEPFVMNWGTANTIEQVYLAGSGTGGTGYVGMYLLGLWRCIFTNIRIDNTAIHGIHMVRSRKCVFTGLILTSTNALEANNTYHGIYLESSGGAYCTDNVFGDIYFGRQLTTVNDYWAYGIYEVDSDQDYNVYDALNGRDCGTGVLRTVGSNSKYDADSIVGTITTS